MPIKKENLGRYPKDWKAISYRIRFERAEGRCECDGRCGRPHDGGRCAARHGLPHPETGSTVILTTMHLDHTPENCPDENLIAGCQRCHLRYDSAHHAATRLAAKEAERRRILDKAGHLQFEYECRR